jgi:hypothetical protein
MQTNRRTFKINQLELQSFQPILKQVTPYHIRTHIST